MFQFLLWGRFYTRVIFGLGIIRGWDLNTVGQCLHFVIEGYDGENPDDLAGFLDATRKYLTKKRR